MKKQFLLALVLTGVGILLSILRPSFFEALEGKLYDLHFVLRGPIPTTDRIVLVTIDEKSLRALGRWPWSRSLIGRVFEKIESQGAEMIAPDIFFQEPSGGPLGDQNDRAFAETLHRHPNILMGYYFLMNPKERQESSVSEEGLEQNFGQVSSSALASDFTRRLSEKFPRLREPLGIQDTLPIFSNLPGGGRHGFFNILSDRDGTVREVPLLMTYRGKVFPSMALQAVRMYLSDFVPHFWDRILLDPEGDLLINYRGAGLSFPRVSVADLWEGKEPVSLKHKIVLVGSAAAGLVDNHPTPLDSAVGTDLLTAHIIDNLLQGDFLHRNATTDLLSRLLIALVGLLFALILPRLKPAPGSLFFLGLMGAEFLALHLFFVRGGLVLQNIYPLFSGFLVYGGTSLYGYLVQEKEKRFINETFQHYLSNDVIVELTTHPEKVRLGGERKELTVFFSDIRNFATIVEQTPPEILGDFLNHYLTPVTDIIFEQKGLLDKYIGDAVMAVFGAPLSDPDHPQLACRAAVEIVRLVTAHRRRWEETFHIPDLRIGIGLNTGLMTVGNMGSERRFDYTVVGDAVNLASRLEGLNKFYGTTILVGPATYEKARDQFLFRELDQVQVKGKRETVRLYELIADPLPEKFLPLFSEALQDYRQARFSSAAALFERGLTLCPEDGPARLFLQRCRQFETAPPADWNGVTVFVEK